MAAFPGTVIGSDVGPVGLGDIGSYLNQPATPESPGSVGVEGPGGGVGGGVGLGIGSGGVPQGLPGGPPTPAGRPHGAPQPLQICHFVAPNELASYPCIPQVNPSQCYLHGQPEHCDLPPPHEPGQQPAPPGHLVLQPASPPAPHHVAPHPLLPLTPRQIPEHAIELAGHRIVLRGTAAQMAEELHAARELLQPRPQPGATSPVDIVHRLVAQLPEPYRNDINACLNLKPLESTQCINGYLEKTLVIEVRRLIEEILAWVEKYEGPPIDPPLPVNARFGQPCEPCIEGVSDEGIEEALLTSQLE